MYYYSNTDIPKCQEETSARKEILYMQHKEKSQKRTEMLYRAYMTLYEETAAEIYKRKAIYAAECATFLTFKRYGNGTTELKTSNRCKDRYCTYCNWIDSRKKSKILAGALQLAECDGNKTVHLIITVPNVTADKLNKQVNTLHSIITAALRHFKIKSYYRATEITYNEKDNTYHPHAHIALINYINVDKLSSYCGYLYKSGNIDYKYDYTICYASGKSLLTELSKYITKPSKMTDKSIYELIKYDALKGIRTYACGGRLKDYITRSKALLETTNKFKAIENKDFGYKIIDYIKNGSSWEMRESKTRHN